MKATAPFPEVPGDNQRHKGFTSPHIMARSGECVGMSDKCAVWRFGSLPGSERSMAYGISLPPARAFLWCLCERDSGTILETFEGYWVGLPESFRKVIEWEPKE